MTQRNKGPLFIMTPMNYAIDAVEYFTAMTCCTKCSKPGTIRDFTVNDDANGIEQRLCTACVALSTCGLCGKEAHHSAFTTVLEGDSFVMNRCMADCRPVTVGGMNG
jgi:hypothetical protein